MILRLGSLLPPQLVAACRVVGIPSRQGARLVLLPLVVSAALFTGACTADELNEPTDLHEPGCYADHEELITAIRYELCGFWHECRDAEATRYPWLAINGRWGYYGYHSVEACRADTRSIGAENYIGVDSDRCEGAQACLHALSLRTCDFDEVHDRCDPRYARWRAPDTQVLPYACLRMTETRYFDDYCEWP